MSSSPKEKPRSFLIECAILAWLVLFVWSFTPGPSLRQSERAKTQAAKSQISTFTAAINLYEVENGNAPTSQQGLQALVTEPTSSPHPKNWKKYLSDVSSVPKDPWGNEYIYQSPGPHGEPFLITSYGADGKPGGRDNDADITSAQPQ